MTLLTEQLTTVLGYPGRMISGSKSGYRDRNPDNFAIFNSNICTEAGKVWFGDIDVTLQKETLCELAKANNETLYVLYEMDARFENEESPLLSKAAIKFLPDGTFKVADRLVDYISKSFFE
jgi:hypothetical protein